MAQWAVMIPASQWATERLFHHDTVVVSAAGADVSPDDDVLLIADGKVVALTKVTKPDGDDLLLTYVRRAVDAPVPATDLNSPVVPLDQASFTSLAAGLAPLTADRKTWLVSVALPIEADTPAEAVRQFWTYMQDLGQAELPTYVWPSGNELAMQAFVLGEEANQDPEEDDEP
jgi:hypothetical protein